MKLLIPFVLLTLCLSVSAEPLTLQITPGSDHNEVQFRSEAATETVVGKTRTVRGTVTLDGAADTASHAEIHVDLASLKTGIDLRDRHMRENHLETSKYPEAVFTLTSLALPTGALAEDVRTPVRVAGRLALHGVERDIAPTTYLTYSTKGGAPSLRIKSQFTVKLPDYKIKRPQFLVMRLAEEQKILVDLTAK